jgi:hypothetical protein
LYSIGMDLGFLRQVLSGMDPLSELVLRAINSKCAIVIYHFMLPNRIGLGSK